jgi:hypothetical protein
MRLRAAMVLAVVATVAPLAACGSDGDDGSEAPVGDALEEERPDPREQQRAEDDAAQDATSAVAAKVPIDPRGCRQVHDASFRVVSKHTKGLASALRGSGYVPPGVSPDDVASAIVTACEIFGNPERAEVFLDQVAQVREEVPPT